MEKKSGYYYGTEMDGKWWRRYMKDGFFARGNGEYWIDNGGLCFLKYLTKKPLFIPFNDVIEIQTGKSHAGKWATGTLAIKIIWLKDGKRLSSGFVFAKANADNLKIKSFLEEKISPGLS